MGNVEHFSIYNGLKDSSIQYIDAVCSIGPNKGLKLIAIIPKSLWGATLNCFLPESFFSHFIPLSDIFNHGAIGSAFLRLHDAMPRTISLTLSHIDAGSTPSTEKEGTMSHGLHFSASLGTSTISQSQQQKSVHTYCLSENLQWETIYH